MISRIRLDAYGPTADHVERTLYPHADQIEKLLGVGVSRGECVIERQLEEPFDSPFTFKGRLILHPDISTISQGNTFNVLIDGAGKAVPLGTNG
jgi:hypothetical protein